MGKCRFFRPNVVLPFLYLYLFESVKEGLLKRASVEALIHTKSENRKWYECDINYNGGYRGAERIVFSNDGLIYYTEDHYESFEKIY